MVSYKLIEEVVYTAILKHFKGDNMKNKIGIVLFLFILSFQLAAQEPFLGEIRIFAGNFAPRSWAFCDGQLLSVDQNQSLFSLLGTTYGGDGRTTFGLPDLRGRAPIHAGQGASLSNYNLGQNGGEETVALTESEIPSHNHDASATVETEVTLPVNDSESESLSPNGNYLAKSRVTAYSDTTNGTYLAKTEATSTATVTVGSTGGAQQHENRPPYLAVHYIICIQGIFPTQN